MAETTINTDNVTVGAPVVGACIFAAPYGTKLPETASEELDAAFHSLGELSDNGYTKGVSISSNKFKGWHGSTILSVTSDEENSLKFEMTEVDGQYANELRYGKDNVKVDEDGHPTAIDPTTVPTDPISFVIDELLSNSRKRRNVVPKAIIDSIDDEAHNKGSLLVYGMSLSLIVDDKGRPYYIREAKPATAGTSK